MEGVPNFKFRSRDLTTPTLGPICCALASACHGQCVHQIWSFYPWSFQIYKGGPKISKMVTWPKPRPFRGQISIFRQRRQASYVSTKFGVRSFIRSKVMEGVPYFKFRSNLGVKFYIPTKGFIKCISPQNLECVSLSVPKLWRGSQILNLGHVTLTTPTLGVSCHLLANTCYDEYDYQIWSLYVKPFHRYWGGPKISIIYWQNLHCACAVSRDT